MFGLKIVQPHRCERALPTAEMSLLLKVTPSAGLSDTLTLLNRSYNTFFYTFYTFQCFLSICWPSVLLYYLIGLTLLSCLLTWKCLYSPSFYQSSLCQKYQYILCSTLLAISVCNSFMNLQCNAYSLFHHRLGSIDFILNRNS